MSVLLQRKVSNISLKAKKHEKMGLLLEVYRKKLRAKIRSEIWQNIHMSLQQAYLRSNLTEKTTQIMVMAKVLLALQSMKISQKHGILSSTREKTTFMDQLRKKKYIPLCYQRFFSPSQQFEAIQLQFQHQQPNTDYSPSQP